jgi:pimeloyl-ACP methyl ester carboxylesterase
MPGDLPILLLPGMAADERLFEPQRACFPDLRVPAWIEPRREEPLRVYAARLARVVDPGCPCIVGGASFGGIVALEMAPHLQALACVLIGSIRSPAELPWSSRFFRPIASLGAERAGVLARWAAWLGKSVLKPGTVRRLQRLGRPESAFTRWALGAVLRWRPSLPTRRVRVFRIHGELDRTLPPPGVPPDEVVPAGGHALTLFRPAVVNEFLARVLEWARPGSPMGAVGVAVGEQVDPGLPERLRRADGSNRVE